MAQLIRCSGVASRPLSGQSQRRSHETLLQELAMPGTETISSLNRLDLIATMPEEGGPLADTAALTVRMARGDESAYREFYAGYFDRLLRYLLVVTQGREEAAREALQLTLMRVVRHIKKFDTETALWSWLTVLARSSVVDEQRKRTRY